MLDLDQGSLEELPGSGPLDSRPEPPAVTEREARALREAILAKLVYAVGREPAYARDHDWFVATALAVRDRVVDRWMATTRKVQASGNKRVYYLSLEFLIGRLLTDTASNLGPPKCAGKPCATWASISTN